MKKEKSDYIKFLIDYSQRIIENKGVEAKDGIQIVPPLLILETRGFYKRNERSIMNSLNVTTKAKIFQILNVHSLNTLQLKKILKYSYPTLYEHIKTLKNLKLVELKEGKSSRGKREIRISIHHNVHIEVLSQKNVNFLVDYLKKEARISEEEYINFGEQLNKKTEEITKEPTVRTSTR